MAVIGPIVGVGSMPAIAAGAVAVVILGLLVYMLMSERRATVRRWLVKHRAQREVGRPIPWPYSNLMTAREREQWAAGWRVDYRVCPSCGHRLIQADRTVNTTGR